MDILVYADWKELEKPAPMGRLSVIHTRGHAVFSFSYDKQWIKEDNAQNLFLDSSPDRWGRVLMDRREAIIAKKENHPVHRDRQPLARPYPEKYNLPAEDADYPWYHGT